MEDIAKVCKENNIIIISDEIYSLIDFSGEKKKGFFHYYPEGTIVTAGLSKSHSAGGYRMGFLATSEHLKPVIKALAALVSETFSAVSAPIQHAAVKAYSLDEDIIGYVDNCTKIHNIVSQYIYKRLISAGIGCSKPEGAFYVLADFDEHADKIRKKLKVEKSLELSEYLLEKYSVALLPGSDFYFPSSRFAFRMATVDYDGGAVYEKIAGKDSIEDSEYEKLFPSIKKGLDALEKFVKDLG
jgi:aspartate aminotransferase